MVHGGGHHHRSGGGGAFGVRRTNNDTCVFNDNNTNDPWFESSGSGPNRGTFERHHHGDQNCPVCCARCLALACCVACCCVGRDDAGPDKASADARDRSAYEPIGSSWENSPPCCGKCSSNAKKGAVFSVLAFVLLVVVSGLQHTWTLNPGETRQISIPIFNHGLVVEGGGRVYQMLGKCPPLTGPTVRLHQSHDLVLSENDYQYDYFYMLDGSTIHLNVTQASGATNVFVLSGESRLQSLDGDSDDDEDDFKNYLRKFFVSAKGYSKGSLDYKVKKSDVYILVYDNASTSKGEFNVAYDLTLKTFDLTGQIPVPSTGDETMIDTSSYINTQCILVEASKDSRDDVRVHVTGRRKWLVICLLSCLPMVAVALTQLLTMQKNAAILQDVRDPFVLPSATAPVRAQAVDYSSVPVMVPPENVVPLTEEREDHKLTF